MAFSVHFKDKDGLMEKLKALRDLNLKPLFEKQRAGMWNRSHKKGAAGGGTPYLSGDLKKSRDSRSSDNEAVFGYNAEHAPHVEFGHRTKNNGWVKGQYYLKTNYELQKEIFKKDVMRILKELK